MKSRILAWTLFGLLGFYTSNPALVSIAQTLNQEQKPKTEIVKRENVTIESLVQSIEKNIAETLPEQDWYARGVDNESNNAAILIPENHERSREGFYNQILDVVLKYAHTIVVGLVPPRSEDALHSILAYYNHYIFDRDRYMYKFEDMLKENKLYEYLSESKAHLIGLEDRELLKTANEFERLTKYVWAVYHDEQKEGWISDQGQHDMIKKWIELYFYRRVDVEELPEYKDEIWKDDGLFNEYWGGLQEVDKKLTEERTKAVFANLKEQFKRLEILGMKQNIITVMIDVGYTPLAELLLNDSKISYIVVGNFKDLVNK